MKAKEIREKAKKKSEKPRSLKIDELGIEIHYFPMTIEFEEHMAAKFEGKPNVNERVWAVEAIMNRALDDEGKQIWTSEEDREFLRKRVASSIITRIINAFSGIGIEDAKKNSRKTQS